MLTSNVRTTTNDTHARTHKHHKLNCWTQRIFYSYMWFYRVPAIEQSERASISSSSVIRVKIVNLINVKWLFLRLVLIDAWFEPGFFNTTSIFYSFVTTHLVELIVNVLWIRNRNASFVWLHSEIMELWRMLNEKMILTQNIHNFFMNQLNWLLHRDKFNMRNIFSSHRPMCYRI